MVNPNVIITNHQSLNQENLSIITNYSSISNQSYNLLEPYDQKKSFFRWKYNDNPEKTSPPTEGTWSYPTPEDQVIPNPIPTPRKSLKAMNKWKWCKNNCNDNKDKTVN